MKCTQQKLNLIRFSMRTENTYCTKDIFIGSHKQVIICP